MLRRHWFLVAVLALAGIQLPGHAQDVPGVPKAEPAKKMPKVWADATGQQIRAAKEVAQTDGMRKIAERIYGLDIDSETSVLDMLLASSEVKTRFTQTLTGVTEGAWVLEEDGSCYVAMKVTWRTAVETAVAAYRSVCKDGRLVEEEKLKARYVKNEDEEIVCDGSGALPGTEGLRIIRAKRAAEIDCYKRLARRVLGVEIDAETHVRDLILASDEMKVTLAHVLKGVRLGDVTKSADGKTVKRSGTLVMKRVIERLAVTEERWVKDGEASAKKLRQLAPRYETTEFTEVGEAATMTPEEADAAALTGKGIYEAEVRIVERILSEGIVVGGDK